MMSNPDQVVVMTDQHPLLQVHSASVHHRDFPEVHAEGRSPEDAAARLAELLSQGLESAPSLWRREILESRHCGRSCVRCPRFLNRGRAMADRAQGSEKHRADPSKVPRPPLRPQFIWYVIMTLFLLWFGQDAMRQVVLRTIPYSEFKAHVAQGEVTECTVESDEITGKVTPKGGTTAAPGTPTEAGANASFRFRSIRIEDPRLVEDLQKAGGVFSGIRPGILSQLLWAWLLPLGAILLFWWMFSRGIGGAGEAMLGFGKSRARLIQDPRSRQAAGPGRRPAGSPRPHPDSPGPTWPTR